jgi:hypothetical protein
VRTRYGRFIDQVQHCRGCGERRIELWGVLERREFQGTVIDVSTTLLCEECLVNAGGKPVRPKGLVDEEGNPLG